MDFREASEILARVTYKAGWTMSLTQQEDGAVLRIKCMEKDATCKQPGLVSVQSQEFLPLDVIRDERGLLDWIKMKLHDREVHELCEWLQIDGVAPYYPH